MKKRSKIIVGLLVLIIALGGFLGLANRAEQVAKPRRTRILFYHEMNGPAAAALTSLVKEYNQRQDKYEVVAEYQGSYNEAVEKFINTHHTSVSPAVFQSMDISTAQIAKSGYTTPIQHFINQDHYPQKQISQAARSYYSYKGKQLAMPFNVSQPVLFYNKTLFHKYHVADLPLQPSYAAVMHAAQELYANSHHQVKGISVEPYSWLFEEFLANANAPLTDQENGHSGSPSHFLLNSQAAEQTMAWLQKLNQNGIMINYGYSSNSDTNEIGGFLAHKIGMFMQTSSQLVQLQNGNQDQIGVCYYPHLSGHRPNGVAIGGAALWISNDHSQKVQAGAWNFIKFLLSPKTQAKWAVKTGYIAANNQAIKEPTLRHYFAHDPAARIASQQLRATKANNYNSGTFVQALPQDRLQIQNMMDRVYEGANVSQNLQATNHELSEQLQQINLADHQK